MHDDTAHKLAQTSILTLAQARLLVAWCEALGVDPFTVRDQAAQIGVSPMEWAGRLSYGQRMR